MRIFWGFYIPTPQIKQRKPEEMPGGEYSTEFIVEASRAVNLLPSIYSKSNSVSVRLPIFNVQPNHDYSPTKQDLPQCCLRSPQRSKVTAMACTYACMHAYLHAGEHEVKTVPPREQTGPSGERVESHAKGGAGLATDSLIAGRCNLRVY